MTESDSYENKITELYREMTKLDPVSESIYKDQMYFLIKVLNEIHDFLESDEVKRLFHEIDGLDNALANMCESKDNSKIPLDGRIHSTFFTCKIRQLLCEFEEQLKISPHLINTSMSGFGIR